MKVCQFNFNNEVDAFEVHVEDDGRVTVPAEDGTTMAEYDSVEQLAEIYAQARGVKPENLKNWVLLENGNEYTYVLRAGTAGVTIAEAYDQVEAAIDALEGYHPLSIARAKEQILGNGDADLVEALVHCTEADIARDVYDALGAVINGDEAEAAEEAAEVDTRSDLERFVDETVESVPGSIRFLAMLANLPMDSEKDAVLEALENHIAFQNAAVLQNAYASALRDAVDNGIGVDSAEDAITVLTQVPAHAKAEDSMKNRIVATAKMASRDKMNLSVDIVGHDHIRHTAEMVPLDDVAGVELYVRGNVPFIVRFDESVDAELEAERQTAEEGAQSVTGTQVLSMIENAEDKYGDEYGEDVEEYEDEEGEE